MSCIDIKNVNKTFKRAEPVQGIKAIAKSLIAPKYREVKALQNVSFSIEHGQKLALLGRNGAGKSTLVKMLVCGLRPDSGELLFNGKSLLKYKNEYKKQLGVMFGQRCQMWWDLPVIDTLRGLKIIYEIDESTYQSSIDLFVEMTGLQALFDVPVKNLSLGQRSICELLATYLHRPKILILDEPTIGLDLNVKDSFRKIVNALHQEFKTTVVLTSHDASDIEGVCQDIVLLDKGQLIYNDTIQSFYQKHGVYCTMNIALNSSISEGWLREVLGKKVSGVENLYIDPVNDRSCEITFDKSKVMPFKILEMIKESHDISEYQLKNSSLESAIKYAYEQSTTV
jgi:ABC-2 type transport system ATP-binding protein